MKDKNLRIEELIERVKDLEEKVEILSKMVKDMGLNVRVDKQGYVLLEITKKQ